RRSSRPRRSDAGGHRRTWRRRWCSWPRPRPPSSPGRRCSSAGVRSWAEPGARGRRRRIMTEEKKLAVLSDDEIERRLKDELPGWWHEGRWIRRKYNTDGWLTTLALVNTIGFLAEAAWHHPDLEVTWGKVWVKLRTHSANGVTERDFAVAPPIEAAVLWKPEAGSPMEGTPNKWVRGGSPDLPA